MSLWRGSEKKSPLTQIPNLETMNEKKSLHYLIFKVKIFWKIFRKTFKQKNE